MRPDDYYMTFAYISEKWLFEYMQENFAESDDEEILEQLADEKKHTKMCLGALNKTIDDPISHDTSFSIEQGIYANIGGWEINEDTFSALSWIVERRALFLYKNYMKHGKDDYYKKITKAILDDERKHIGFHDEVITDNHLKIKAIDKAIWKRAGEVYGPMAMFELPFWEDLFSGALKDKLNVQLP